MSVVPVLSKTAVAYGVGMWVGDQVTSPLLNKVIQHLDSYSASTRKKIEFLVPFIGIGAATLAAYSIHPRSKAVNPTNLFLQGVVFGIHTCAMKFFLNQSKGGVYTVEAQIEKYLGISDWAATKKDVSKQLELISTWDFYEKLSEEDKDQLTTFTSENPLNLDQVLSQYPNEKAKIEKTLATFQDETLGDRQCFADFLKKYYSWTQDKRDLYREQIQKTRDSSHLVAQAFDTVTWLFHSKLHDRLVGPSVPFAFTDRCCALFPPFYLLRAVPLGCACNRKEIFFSAVSLSVQSVAHFILEYIPLSNHQENDQE